MLRRIKFLFAILLGLAVTACAGPTVESLRDPVPEPLVARSTVPGYSRIRYWGDNGEGLSPTLVAEVVAQQRAAGMSGDRNYLAVSGGGSYWHRRASGEDAGAMVLDELIPMLADKGLDTSRVGFIGWSMGGYGALLLGARLGPARTAAICAVSPALWLSPGTTAPGAFDGAEDFAANTVFGLPALGRIPLRIDCGYSDPFYPATREFVAQLPNPPAGGFSPGGHDGGFWSSQLPAEIAWLAPLLTA